MMNNDEVVKQKSLQKKKKTGIQKRKLADTLFATYVSSENICILTLCCQ